MVYPVTSGLSYGVFTRSVSTTAHCRTFRPTSTPYNDNVVVDYSLRCCYSRVNTAQVLQTHR